MFHVPHADKRALSVRTESGSRIWINLVTFSAIIVFLLIANNFCSLLATINGRCVCCCDGRPQQVCAFGGHYKQHGHASSWRTQKESQPLLTNHDGNSFARIAKCRICLNKTSHTEAIQPQQYAHMKCVRYFHPVNRSDYRKAQCRKVQNPFHVRR